MDPPPPNKTEPEDKSKRDLSAAEIEVLQQISARVKEIAEDGSLRELALKGPLGENCPAELADIFINRFKALPGLLTWLTPEPSRFTLQTKKIKASGQLPAGQAAKTDVKGTDHSATVIWLATAALRTGQTAQALTDHVLTVIHELTHALESTSGFPVKDYAYQDSWAYGFLPPDIVTCNADSYRHLAFLIVSQRNGNQWLYAPRGPVPRQRRALRQCGLGNLSNALALANIRLDRAWIRALDCQSFAGSTPDRSVWEDLGRPDAAMVNEALQRKIEDWLREKEIVGERETNFLFNMCMTEQDRTAIDNIYTFLTWVKGVMDKMTVALSGSGEICYDKTDKRLTIPYASLDIAVEPLAKQILGVISDFKTEQKEGAKASKASLEKMTSNRVDLIFVLSYCDRPDVREKADALCRGLMKGAFPVPSNDNLAGINTEMALAALESCADDWQRISSEVHHDIYHLNPASKQPDALTTAYAAACGALKHLDSLPGELAGPQRERRQNAAGAIVSCAELIEKKVQLTRPPDDLLVKDVRR